MLHCTVPEGQVGNGLTRLGYHVTERGTLIANYLMRVDAWSREQKERMWFDIAMCKYGMSAKFTHLLLYIMIMLIILYPEA